MAKNFGALSRLKKLFDLTEILHTLSLGKSPGGVFSLIFKGVVTSFSPKTRLKTLGERWRIQKLSNLAEILRTCSLTESLTGVFFSCFQNFDI